ncbi:MAG: NAD-dependent epimerase/dehydratase family protein [Planctomycetota bacterium]|jgi:nucleoside-diphosphate-sugar epimerase|nr:NAD-dependent epimerase/dehydratase family protein [Planctomycetota bacterium]
MDVLIIGGSGNISGAVVTLLLEQGHAVTLCNRGSQPAPAKCDHIACDRTDPEAFAAAIGGRHFDAAIDFFCFKPEHAAGAHRALAGHCDHYLFISSATVYQKPHQVPVQEGDPRGNPASPYAENKRLTEDWLLAHQDALPLTIVRPSHTFCERWIPSPLHGADFTVAARIRASKPIIIHDDGRSLWALTTAEDFAVGLCGLVGLPQALGESYHITTDEVATWRSIYHEIGLALGAEAQPVFIPTSFLAEQVSRAGPSLAGDKAHHGVFDNTKIKQAVPAFSCQWRLRDSLARSVAWALASPERQVVNADKDAEIDAIIEAWHTAV